MAVEVVWGIGAGHWNFQHAFTLDKDGYTSPCGAFVRKKPDPATDKMRCPVCQRVYGKAKDN